MILGQALALRGGRFGEKSLSVRDGVPDVSAVGETLRSKVESGSMDVGAKEFHGALHRVAGIVPRLLVVAIVKLLAKPANVLSYFVEISILKLRNILVKVAVFFLIKLVFCALHKHSVVWKAKILLRP